MDEFDLGELADDGGEGVARVVKPGSSEFVRTPSQWRMIAESADPAARCAAALSLWNRDFLEMVPKFGNALKENLMDVRVCVLNDEWVLVYVIRADREPYIVWVGWDPATFGESLPPHWDYIPKPLQDFLSNVHAGFTGPDCESYGAVPPEYMTTYAKRYEYNGPIPGWEEDQQISSTRLLFVTKASDLLEYYASPDLPPGKIALVYEGDIDPREDFGAALDELMSSRFEVE